MQGGQVFVYGTLMADEVLRLLLKRVPPSKPATLAGHRRHAIKGQVFPAIVPAEADASVRGKVLLQLSDKELNILDVYESEEYYRTRVAPVLDDGEKVDADVYIWRDAYRDQLQPGEWDYGAFMSNDLAPYLEMTREFMREFFEQDGGPVTERLAAQTGARCWGPWGGKPRAVLFVADPGTFSNTPENAVYLKNLKKAKKLKPGESGCPEIVVGEIMRQRVAVVTTGIGPEATAMCVFEVLTRCGRDIRDATYSGTSGWSPQLGGILNNGSCEAGSANSNGKLARIGDVCVSPFAVNWDCRIAPWSGTAAGYDDQCTFPGQQFGPLDPQLFGICAYYSGPVTSSLGLADEVLAAAAKGAASFPPRPASIEATEKQYWAAMANGTKVQYPAIPSAAPPKLWSYRECMEISSQYFWSGAPWDMVARKYVADTLNAGGRTPAPGRNYTQADVLAVSAMEAVGLAAAFTRYSGMTGARAIPYTVVRGMSNWAVMPVARVAGANGTAGANATTWVNGPPIGSDFVSGYKFAIQSASATVLSLLKERCLAGASAKQAAECTFTVQA
ncbi:MAG: hypothetical protein J3K34DRAFT_524060 [Monoraphidium minutum]|nr:MAG: hypothetical protein J3K34DRAFT_524060 [Monoraphidium minutum]